MFLGELFFYLEICYMRKLWAILKHSYIFSHSDLGKDLCWFEEERFRLGVLRGGEIKVPPLQLTRPLELLVYLTFIVSWTFNCTLYLTQVEIKYRSYRDVYKYWPPIKDVLNRPCNSLHIYVVFRSSPTVNYSQLPH